MGNRKIGFLVITLLATMVAVAAEQPSDTVAATEPEQPQELAQIVVTGSSIPTTPDAVAVPIETLDAAQLEASGVNSNALEILRKEIPAFQGRSNAGTSNANNNNQNTAGGSQVQLRNLPTLVLVDGRRVANSGIGAINGKNFVDVNQIPAAAIDHIDVLTDGASSIYGSDAVGGVVNFILKSNYRGFTAGARAATGVNYGEWSAYATGGLPIGGGNITVTLNFSHTDPLFQNNRPFSSPLYGKTFNLPGTVNGAKDILSAGLTSPSAKNPTGVNATANSLVALEANGTYIPTSQTAVANAFDISPYQTLLLKQNLASFTSTFNLPIADRGNLALFGDLLVSQDKSFTQFAPVAATGLPVPVDAPYNPLTIPFPGGVTFSYLPNPHDFYDTTTAARITAGLRGEITHAWTWETALVYSESDLRQDQTNLIFKPNLAPAIAGGYNAAGQPVLGGPYSQVYGGYSLSGPLLLQPALDPFATAGGLNPGSLANLYGTEVIHAVSQLQSWDGKIVGRVAALPAGDIGLAVGATVRREVLSGHADANGRVTDPVTGAFGVNSQFWIGGTFADPFSAARTISGAFAEVRVPITSEEWSVPVFRAFDLTAAERSEHYSDAGSSSVPKFGFRWQPFDKQLTLRGNYAKSFLAPNLFSESGPTDTRQVAGAVMAGVFGPNYALPFNVEDGNNPNIKPATSTSKTIGFVIKPALVKGLTLTADYSDIVLRGFQAGIGNNNILLSVNTLGSASPYFVNLAIGNFPGQGGASNPFAAPGALLAYLTNPATGKGDPTKATNLYSIDRFENNAELLEQSWTLSARYAIPTEHLGDFEIGTTGSIFDSFKSQGLPGQAFIQYAGHATNAGVFGGTLPKYHFYTTLDWVYHDLDLGVANSYLSAVTDIGINGDKAPLPVSRYSSWDVRAAYDWHKMKAAVGINNLTNRMPPLAPRTFNDNNADVATYSPIGRLVYATVSVML